MQLGFLVSVGEQERVPRFERRTAFFVCASSISDMISDILSGMHVPAYDTFSVASRLVDTMFFA